MNIASSRIRFEIMIKLPKISLLILAVTIFFCAQPLEAAQKKSSKSKNSQTSAVQKKPTSKKSKVVKKKNARKNKIPPQQSPNGSSTPTPIPQLRVTVSTLAGSGAAGYADGQGTAASFNSPGGLAVDGSGNVYVSDNGTAIRKISPSGNVTTLAGSDTAGYADGQGTDARFNFILGVAVDGSESVYVTDLFGEGVRIALVGSPRIRKITPSGNVMTLAGGGDLSQAWGIAVDMNGNVFVPDVNQICKISPSGNVTTLAGSNRPGYADGLGTQALFSSLLQLALDGSGNVYVADADNNAIRKISPSGNVTTLAGLVAVSSIADSSPAGYTDGQGAEARFYLPLGVAVDGSGNVYVADSGNHRIRKISPSGNVTTLAGSGASGYADGSGAEARFNWPSGVAVDKNGNVYVTDATNAIRKITISQ